MYFLMQGFRQRLKKVLGRLYTVRSEYVVKVSFSFTLHLTAIFFNEGCSYNIFSQSLLTNPSFINDAERGMQGLLLLCLPSFYFFAFRVCGITLMICGVTLHFLLKL